MARKKVVKKKSSNRRRSPKAAVASHAVRSESEECRGSWQKNLAIASFVLLFVKLWPGALEWVGRTNAWWFVLALVVFLVWSRK